MSDTVKREHGDSRSHQRLVELAESINSVILGKEDVVRRVVIALLARGNLLIEDIPGVGKTTLAQALARSIDCSFQRIQFTSDLLPGDILGVKVYEPKTSEFKFMPGPIFNSIVLADEINRTSPRTQSALLEAMNDGQVTIEGETHSLPRPFMVIATQNPVEHHGAYPLPDSQLDRFLMSVSVGYPDLDDERKIIFNERVDLLTGDLPPVMDADEVIRWQDKVDQVRMEPEIADYALALVAKTRGHRKIRLGVSPRGSIALTRAARAAAVFAGRGFCVPDDVKALAAPVLAHRVLAAGPAGMEERKRTAAEAIEEIVDSTPVPL